MAIRQYIGARYVPLFEGPWDITKSYEHLVIVSHEGNSYTSKKAVPSGINIDNEEYWVLTSNFNAQIEAYRNDVRRVEAKYDNLVPLEMFEGSNAAEKLSSFLAQDDYLNVSVGDIEIDSTITLTDPEHRDLRTHTISNGSIVLSKPMFSEDYAFLPRFNNVVFKSSGSGNYIFDGVTEVGLACEGCTFDNVGVAQSTGYLQSPYLIGCNFYNMRLYSIKTKKAYDCKVLGCRFESSIRSAVVITGDDNFCYESLVIDGNLFEGFRNQPAIVVGNGFGGTISRNYFESNIYAVQFTSPNTYISINDNAFFYNLSDYAVDTPMGNPRAIKSFNNIMNDKKLYKAYSFSWQTEGNFNYSAPNEKLTGGSRHVSQYSKVEYSNGTTTIRIPVESPFYYMCGIPINIAVRARWSNANSLNYFGYLNLTINTYIDNTYHAAVDYNINGEYPGSNHYSVSTTLSDTNPSNDGTEIIITITGAVEQPEVYLHSMNELSYEDILTF